MRAVVIKVDGDRAVTFANNYASELLLGYSNAELVGRRLDRSSRRSGTTRCGTHRRAPGPGGAGQRGQPERDEVGGTDLGRVVEPGDQDRPRARGKGSLRGQQHHRGDEAQETAGGPDRRAGAGEGGGEGRVPHAGRGDPRRPDHQRPGRPHPAGQRADRALFGYLREELIGQPIELLVPERLRRNIRPCDGATTGTLGPRRRRADAHAVGKDGGEFPVEIGLSPLPDPDGEGTLVCSSLRDIRELRRLEQEVVVSEERNRLILESSSEGIFGVDRSGTITFVNPAATRLLGYAPEELIGQGLTP